MRRWPPRTRSWSARRRRGSRGELVVHDAKAQRIVDAADDTLLAAYLIEPGRATYELDDLGAEYGVDVVLDPPAEEETTALVRRAELPRRLIGRMRERLTERGAERLYREIELPLTEVLAAMEDAGVKIDTYRMGEITARLADRVEELEARAYELAGEEFVLGSTPQVGADPVREAPAHPGSEGQDRLLDGHARAADDPRTSTRSSA